MNKCSKIKRLTKEYDNIIKDDKLLSEFNIEINADNICLPWIVNMYGAKDSVYENGIFKLQIELPDLYPLSPPKVKFLTKMYHPNITTLTGYICVSILEKDNWVPSMTIYSTVLSIKSLLLDPNPHSPLESEIAKLYLTNVDKYYENVKKYVLLYAIPTNNNNKKIEDTNE